MATDIASSMWPKNGLAPSEIEAEERRAVKLPIPASTMQQWEFSALSTAQQVVSDYMWEIQIDQETSSAIFPFPFSYQVCTHSELNIHTISIQMWQRPNQQRYTAGRRIILAPLVKPFRPTNGGLQSPI